MAEDTETRELLKQLLQIIEGNTLSNQGVASALGTLTEQQKHTNEKVDRLVRKVELGGNGTGKPLVQRMDSAEDDIEKIKTAAKSISDKKQEFRGKVVMIVIGYVVSNSLGIYAAFIRPAATHIIQPAPVIEKKEDSTALKREDFDAFRREVKESIEQMRRENRGRGTKPLGQGFDPRHITRGSPMITLGMGPDFESGRKPQ